MSHIPYILCSTSESDISLSPIFVCSFLQLVQLNVPNFEWSAALSLFVIRLRLVISYINSPIFATTRLNVPLTLIEAISCLHLALNARLLGLLTNIRALGLNVACAVTYLHNEIWTEHLTENWYVDVVHPKNMIIFIETTFSGFELKFRNVFMRVCEDMRCLACTPLQKKCKKISYAHNYNS